MGVYGNIVIYPKGKPIMESQELSDVARDMLKVFELHGLVRGASTAQPCPHLTASFEGLLEEGVLAPGDYACLTLNPSQLTPRLGELVCVLHAVADDPSSPIELPYVTASVFQKRVRLVDFASGIKLGRTWAAVEFSYEDVRLDERVHLVRDKRHPVFRDLKRLLGSRVTWDVVCY